MSIRLTIIQLALLLALPLFAQAQVPTAPLSGSEIRAQFFEKTMSGEYPSGQTWAERFNSNGTSNYSQSGTVTQGKMTLNGNILCFTYKNPQNGGCFEVWKHGPNCFSFYGSSSIASLDQRQFGRAWDARGWYTGQPPTCAGDQIS